jgi:hypothetical protein
MSLPVYTCFTDRSVLLYSFSWPLCCLFFFDIRILITTFVSSTLLTDYYARIRYQTSFIMSWLNYNNEDHLIFVLVLNITHWQESPQIKYIYIYMIYTAYCFNPFTILCLSQTRPWIPNVIGRVLFKCVMIWGER